MSVDQSAEAAARVAPTSVAARATGTDTGELDALFEAHGAACYGLARHLLRDSALAQDAVQEAFLQHWRGSAFDPALSTPRSWLLMLTHRKAVDRVRYEQRRTSLPLEAAAEPVSTCRSPEDLALANLQAPKVRAALASLSEAQREALTLAYWGCHTQREIAAITRVPLGTVKTRMRSGMIRLREALGDQCE